MNLKPIKTEADYQVALANAYQLMDAEWNTPEGEELEILTAIIENYEAKHYPMTPPDPVAAIKFRMEQLDLGEQDLEPWLGNREQIRQILNRQQDLSVGMIRQLHRGLKIPLESLIGE
ncbi:MAG: DNA-binding protein [Thiotrichaceae bacterium IS1]|nr:MAG: DNA-binding protein [Thiotrichaceae bacterium IS1]